MSDLIMTVHYHGATYCLECGRAAGASFWSICWIPCNPVPQCATCGAEIDPLGRAKQPDGRRRAHQMAVQP